ncbi:MAG: hypothetical protein L0Z50_22080 [Verrucomicrobiales bacterium]|nr:hypothetical protein [Verrucomicrobiales bacterium]
MKLAVVVFGGVQLVSLLLLISLQAATIQFAPKSGSDFDVLVSEDSGVATLVLNRAGDLDQSASARFEAIDVTAAAPSDFVTTNGVVTFGPGETQKAIAIAILNDGLREDLEWFHVTLAAADDRTVIGSNQTARVGINDNDSGFQFTQGSVSVDEGREAIQVSVRLENDGPRIRTNRSATAGADYIPASGTLQFGPLEEAKTITIPIRDDWLAEGDEEFEIVLANPSPGITLSERWRALVTIYDDEKATALDLSFHCEIQGYPNVLAFQADGRLLVGGAGLRAGSDEPQPIVRLFPDGTIDRSFHTELNPPSEYSGAGVNSLTLLRNGSMLVAGVIDARGVRGLARLRSDGSLDETFSADLVLGGSVNALLRLPDGRLLVGGGANSPEGRRARLLRGREWRVGDRFEYTIHRFR